uniref:ATP-dependent RNA helicase SUV3 homolog, mitochondrial n=1 Tax=Cacopsylla melanoneura TaxID=428564 RepID=A0A8D8TMU9_9HEMI
MLPELACWDDLKKISDLRNPAEWYPKARSFPRRIIFHAGPTNSGKTYQALEKFLAASSGVYCGPLKLLATEVFKKANDRGTPCDLITGEEKRYVQGEENPSNHVACTVEMTNFNVPYEVAVIDEIQMMKDVTRGWAWTRALLGLMAKEIHVCGEAGAVDLVKSIMMTTNEDVEVYKYKRLTELTIEDSAVGSLDNIQPGDCIVCFSKNDVYTVSQGLERRRKKVAVIYGSLPPTIKLAQAAKFNDPNNPCKVMVATDAIGMGLNLSIRRIVFYSVQKLFTNEAGKTEMGVISASAAHQIAGRAGRCNTQFEKGFVTTYKSEDLSTLKKLLSKTPEPITKAGLYPTSDQIEQYASHLPNARLSNLMSVFESLSIVDDSLYFLSNMETFKHLADLIQHVKIPVRTRYVFCCAPISQKMQFACKMFTKFAQQYSRRKPITVDWLCSIIDWPVSSAYTMKDLFHLESVFDVLELYLWFSYRYSDDDEFCDPVEVGDMQDELIELIREGMKRVIRLWDNIPDTYLFLFIYFFRLLFQIKPLPFL